ncbi:MAG: glycosyltransferase [Lentisphaeria bacterium]|nr:glycosyltransferase [Lentisphaeria bacterium]
MLFSIITVCFNSSATIRETFESVLSQDPGDYEYIVVDGGSTDGTVDIIREYEPRFRGRMRWLSEPDEGIYFAMNKGVKLARGAYVNFMNSDDRFEPDALRKTAQVIGEHPGFGVYFGATRWVDREGKEIQLLRFHPDGLLRGYGLSLCHQGVFEKRELFEKYGFFSTKYRVFADMHHISLLKKGGESFWPLDFSVALYRLGGISNAQDHSEEFYDINIELGVPSYTPRRKWMDCWKKRIRRPVVFVANKLLSACYTAACLFRPGRGKEGRG